MTFRQGKPKTTMAPCIPTKLRHACARCLRQRVRSSEGIVIDASIMLWRNEQCPMQETPSDPMRGETSIQTREREGGTDDDRPGCAG